VIGRDLLVIAAMALGVFLPKLLPVLLVGDRLSPGLRRWLRYVAPAVLSALVAPAVLAPSDHLTTPGWDQAGYVTAFIVAVTTRRMLPAVASGLAVVLLVGTLRG
jgi:branched-subunit amino acid transport protein